MKKYIYEVDLDKSNGAPIQIFRFVGKNKRVLEIGCASGCQSKILTEDLNCTVTGIEINPIAAEDARKYCQEVIVGDINSILRNKDLAGKDFDVVLIADVLEHLYDPRHVLEDLRTFISKEGYIVASIPNIVHSSVIYEMMKGKFDYREYGLLDSTHIHFFTRKNIYKMFESAGYLITRLERRSVAPLDSEFNTQPITEQDKVVLDYIQKNNSEWDTYQFVVEARPVSYSNNSSINSALIEAQEQIELLQNDSQEKDLQLKKLQSELSWILNRPINKQRMKIVRFFKTLFS